MAYEIHQIGGIDDQQRGTLVSAGVTTTGELLVACSTSDSRRTLAARTGIDEIALLRWARLADLMRVSGVGYQYAELLDAAGIFALEALRSEDPDQLAERLAEINGKTRYARTCPGPVVLARWIAQARRMRPLLEHDHEP